MIDVFYKIWWLHAAGIKVHLHSFSGKRPASPELERLCASVHYYSRRTGVLSNLSYLPYTVRSRRSEELRKNLLANEYPILFEVLHTCWLMKDPAFAGRKKIYRHSNIEHFYYHAIARSERGLLRKAFHHIEAVRLRLFEGIVRYADLILAVNENDARYFRRRYPEVRCEYLPSFHSHEHVKIAGGIGAYALFHGNLSIAENQNAVFWLIRNVLAHATEPAIIAGLDPPSSLVTEIKKHPHISLVSNPTNEQMDRLIRDAQVHLLYTAQPTGLKLKLLNVIFSGRFILCNSYMLSGTGLLADESVFVAETAAEFRELLTVSMKKEVTERIRRAREIQAARFSNSVNAGKLIGLIFE